MKDAIAFVERIVAWAQTNSGVTNDVEQQVSQMLSALLIPPEIAFPLFARVTQLKRRANMQKLDRAVAELEAKGDATEDDERHIHHLQATLAILPEEAQPFHQRLAYLKKLTRIRKGNLPSIKANVQLESDEICHLETSATYHKVNMKSTTYIAGRLVATNKRLHFLSTTRGITSCGSKCAPLYTLPMVCISNSQREPEMVYMPSPTLLL